MQDRYAGDIGDFGKLGLLRALESAGLSVGVNWYLVPDEIHNNDGRYVKYLDDESYRRCDAQLWAALRSIVKTGKRKVSSLEEGRLANGIFYSVPLDYSGKTRPGRAAYREKWHKNALGTLAECDIVFADPDNGLLVPSAEGTARENKYVKLDELSDYYRRGASVIYYQHKARKPDRFYIDRHKAILDGMGAEIAAGLKFTRTSQRYYFFVIRPAHKERICSALEEMMSSPWKELFELLEF